MCLHVPATNRDPMIVACIAARFVMMHACKGWKGARAGNGGYIDRYIHFYNSRLRPEAGHHQGTRCKSAMSERDTGDFETIGSHRFGSELMRHGQTQQHGFEIWTPANSCQSSCRAAAHCMPRDRNNGAAAGMPVHDLTRPVVETRC